MENELFGNILEYHAEFMLDNSNYKHNNHSLMMDRSLMLIGLLLKNDRYFDIGYYRSIDTFWRSFSKQGLHLENSPDYHIMVTKMYTEMETILNQFDKTYGELVNNMLSKAQRLSGQIVLHTNELPIIGDTNNEVMVPKTSYENFIDYEAGLAILQNENIYLGFISGYSTITHKHHDDLSIIFMYKNRMIFEDGGKYNYSNDNIRQYMLSVNAHSNIHINNQDYELDPKNIILGKVKIINSFENEVYSLIKGQNLSYENVNIYRTIIVINKANTILMIDEVYTKNEVKVTHTFNLSHQVNLDNYYDDYVLENKEARLRFKEYTAEEKLRIANSNNSDINIVNSIGLNEKSPTNQLILEEKIYHKSKKLFILSDSKDEISAFLKNDIVNIVINNKNYHINY